MEATLRPFYFYKPFYLTFTNVCTQPKQLQPLSLNNYNFYSLFLKAQDKCQQAGNWFYV